MPLQETALELAQDIISPEPTESIDWRQKLRDAGFTQEAISGLWDELIQRFEAALPIYSRGVEGNLALREALSMQQVEANEATGDQLSIALEEFINAHPSSIGWSIQQTAQEQIDTFTTNATQELTDGIQNQLEQRPIISWIAEKILGISSSDIVNYGIEKARGNWKMLSLIGIAFALFWLGKSNMFQEHIDSLTGFVPNIWLDWILPTTDNQAQENLDIVDNSDKVGTVSFETKSRAATSWWYLILTYMSWNRAVESSDSLAVYEILWEKSLNEARDDFENLEYEGGKIKPGEILRVFWIEGSWEDEVEHFNTIKWIVWPYTNSFLNSMFTPHSNVHEIILKSDSSGNFSDAALELFTLEELNRIQWSNGYNTLQIDELSRLTILYCKSFYGNNVEHLQQAIWEVSSSVKDFIFGWEVQAVFNNLTSTNRNEELYPASVWEVFANILTGDQYINSNTHALTTWRSGFEGMNSDDIDKIDAIVSFRNQITDIIPAEFSLWIPGFATRFWNQLDYAKVLSLYVMLGWKDLTERTEMDDILIYTWVYNLFEWSDQWLYESAALEKLGDDSDDLSEDQKNVLTMVLFRTVEANRNWYIDWVARVASLWHGLVTDQILWDLDVNPRVKDYLAYTLETAWAYGLWRILSLFPTTRAVLFVTWWVTIWAVLLLSREGIYQWLSNEIQAEFDLFLENNLAWDSGLSWPEIRSHINNWETWPLKLISNLNAGINESLS
jgi:hypothetical protein